MALSKLESTFSAWRSPCESSTPAAVHSSRSPSVAATITAPVGSSLPPPPPPPPSPPPPPPACVVLARLRSGFTPVDTKTHSGPPAESGHEPSGVLLHARFFGLSVIRPPHLQRVGGSARSMSTKSALRPASSSLSLSHMALSGLG